MSDFRISLIIPAYNEERHLAACLDSIAGQTVPPYEVLIVDNNSTDETVAIARRYPFAKLLNESRQGLVFSRTRGLDAAAGDILVRIDADARLQPEWLQSLQRTLEQHPSAAAITGRGIFYDTPWPKFLGQVQVLFFQYLQFPAMRGHTLWGANMAVRRDAWLAVRDDCHSRTDIDEDIDLSLQLQKHRLKIFYAPALRAAMSLRRDQTDPLKVAKYVSTWPRDYAINGRPIAALYISCVTLAVIICSSVAWTLLPFLRKR